jgi:dTDP-4-amino-4,6-dideoxygalactose transaminase
MKGRPPGIAVTEPFLPPLAEFVPLLQRIWDSKWITNSGPMHDQLEEALARFLKVPHVVVFNNGTSALFAAIQHLGRTQGQVVTTPFSFVATANAILLNGLEPVFADIDADTFGLDPDSTERAFTGKTVGVLPVHTYGLPCDVAGLAEVGREHDVPVIYDAAHAFAVELHDASLLLHGELSVLSFHATKVFNTIEGGAVVCHDVQTRRRLECLRNFGFTADGDVERASLNGKMNEVQAAFGLLQLGHIAEVIARRRATDSLYRSALANVAGIHVPSPAPGVSWNCSYFPILVRPEFPLSRDRLFERLVQAGCLVRRYFFPLISSFAQFRSLPSATRANLPVASRVAEQVICLPMHHNVADDAVARILDVLMSAASRP